MAAHCWQRLYACADALAPFYAERGDTERAVGLYEQAAALLDPLDDSPTWRGTNRYNVACGYALAGMNVRAIQALREALQLHPGLKEWAKEDPDFVSL